MKVSLCGFMGSGKSSVAQCLAKRMNLNLVETDQLVLAISGEPSISMIFSKYGEQHFRKLERQIADDLSDAKEVVISTGGGFVINPDNVKQLKIKQGLIIYLRSAFETIKDRLANLTDRPLFKDLEAAQELFDRRQPIYAACCDHSVNTDGRSITAISDEVECFLRERIGEN